jgi:hypothetical protein
MRTASYTSELQDPRFLYLSEISLLIPSVFSFSSKPGYQRTPAHTLFISLSTVILSWSVPCFVRRISIFFFDSLAFDIARVKHVEAFFPSFLISRQLEVDLFGFCTRRRAR